MKRPLNILCLVLAPLLAASLQLTGAYADPLLSAVPPQAQAAALIDLRPESESMKALSAAQTPEQLGVWRAGVLLGLQQALSQVAPGLDVETDVIPLLTQRLAACWMPPTQGGGDEPILLLETEGGTAAAAGFERLAQAGVKGGTLTAQPPIEGAPVWRVGKNGSSAPPRGLLLLAQQGRVVIVARSRGSMEQVIRQARVGGGGPLSPAAAALAGTPVGILRIAAAPRQQVQGQPPPFGLPGVAGLQAAVRFTAEGAAAEIAAPVAPGIAPWKALAGLKPTFGESVAGIPDSAAVVLIAARPADWFRAVGIPVVDGIAMGLLGPPPLRALGRQLGPILGDVLNHEVAVGLLPVPGGFSWLAVGTSARPDDLIGNVQQLVAAGQKAPGLAWTAAPPNAQHAWSVRVPIRADQPPAEIHFAVVGARLLLAGDRHALAAGMAALRGEIRSVAATEWGQRDVDELGRNALIKGGGDPRALASLLAGRISAGPGAPPAKYLVGLADALLVGFRRVDASLQVEQNAIRVAARIGLDYPRLAGLGAVIPATIGLVVARPAIRQARDQGNTATCVANVRQLGMAAILYAKDHGRLPPADQWVEALEPYYGDRSVLRCPADSAQHRCSYAFNRALAGMPLEQVRNPAATVIFYETTSPDAAPSGAGEDLPRRPRHGGGHVFGFADGRVAVASGVPADAWTPASAAPAGPGDAPPAALDSGNRP